jgi:glycine/D-amino acid oxidase-like deaminating enzyme
MKIAIIGAGFSGIATAWHLLQSQKSISIVVFDSNGIGGGASGIAAGLLHPYAGAHAKMNWQGDAGMQATKHLLDIASTTLGTPVADYSGILRIAVTNLQKQDFKTCAENYSDTLWLTAEECQKMAPRVVHEPGLLIKSGITVNSTLYLQGLWKSCESRGAILKKQKIQALAELEHFDTVVIATGASSNHFPELSDLPINQVKGQILEVSWPADAPAPSIPVNSQAYIIMNSAKQSCIVGATFEHHFTNPNPIPEIATTELMPKAEKLFPFLKESIVLDCRAGVRASTPSHRPMAKRINEKCWVISGMGSKGLLYHALFAEQLAREIVLGKSN